jgi:hypothetical protein
MNIQDYFSKLGKQEKIFVFAAGAFLFIMLMDRMVMGPIMSHMKVQDASIEAKAQMLERSKKILSFSDSIYRDYAKYDAYLNSPDTNQQEMISNDLHAVESFAREKTITISNIKAGDITESPISREFLINIDCEGTLPNTLEFLKSLESSSYLFRIKKITLVPKSKTSELIKCSLELIRTIIFRDPDEERASVENKILEETKPLEEDVSGEETVSKEKKVSENEELEDQKTSGEEKAPEEQEVNVPAQSE